MILPQLPSHRRPRRPPVPVSAGLASVSAGFCCSCVERRSWICRERRWVSTWVARLGRVWVLLCLNTRAAQRKPGLSLEAPKKDVPGALRGRR